jgi:O-antigen ligase
MYSGTQTRRRPAATRIKGSSRRAPKAHAYVPILFVAVVYGLLLRPAMSSLLIAIGVVGLLGLLGLVAAVGADRASTVLLVLAFGFAPLTNFSLGLKPFVLASAFFFMAFGLVVPRLIREPIQLPKAFLLGALLFTVMGFVSLPLALSAVESLIFVVTAILGLLVMPAMVAWMRPTYEQIYVMVVAFGIGISFSTLYGLPRNFYRNYGFTYHPVALAYTCLLALAFIPFMLASKAPSRWIFIPPIAALALVGTWTSGSRTNLIVIAALVVLVPMLERSLRLGLAVIAGLLLLMPSVVNVNTSRSSTGALSRLFGGGGATASDTTRLTTIHDGLRQIQEHPLLGNGYSVEHTYVIHNIYLQVLAAEGLFGLVGLLLIFSAYVYLLRTAAPLERSLIYPALAVILAGPFQPNMGDHYIALSLGLTMVAIMNTMNKRQAVEDSPGDVSAPGGAHSLTEMPQTRV